MTATLASLGWDAEFETAFGRYSRSCLPGRVARVDRGVCTVLGTGPAARASLAGRMLSAVAADPLAAPSVGDWVAVRRWSDDRCTVEAVLPRRSALVRAGAGKSAQGQAVAANVDVVAVVEALDPDPDPGRIERLTALAWESGAQPLLVLTKADAVDDPELLRADLAASAPGAEAIAVSAVDGAGLEELSARLEPGRTMAMLGASGAGKSTLVNALAGAEVMTVRGLRRDGRGRHTTTHRALIPLPGGALLLDTPGLRVVGLFDRRPGDATAPADGLARAFEDLEELAARCRFSDCKHRSEPDCAVLTAVSEGDVTARRLENWRKLQREAAFERARAAARARLSGAERAARKRAWKQEARRDAAVRAEIRRRDDVERRRK